MQSLFSAGLRKAFPAPSAVNSSAFASTELNVTAKRFASHKQGGKSKNGRDSNPKYRGWKKGHFEEVEVGNIILRQKGTKWHPGSGVDMGRDFTIYATKPGFVFLTRQPWHMHGSDKEIERGFVHVIDVRPEAPQQDIR